jgi:hypothetical protein
VTAIRWFELSLILACFTTAAVAIVAVLRDKRHGSHAQAAAPARDTLRVKLWDAFWLWRGGETPRTAISLCFDRQPARAKPAPRDWGTSRQMSAAARTGELAAIGDVEARIDRWAVLDEHDISDEEFEAAKADAIDRFGKIPPFLQHVIDSGGRFGVPVCGECGEPSGAHDLYCSKHPDPLPVLRGQVARIGAGIDAATQTAPWEDAPELDRQEAIAADFHRRRAEGRSDLEAVAIERTTPPLPAPLHTGYLHAAPDTPAATFDAAVTDLSMRAIPGRTILREHVAATMKHTRSPLGAWVDEVLAADVPLVDQELGLLGARLELREVTRG